MPTAILRTVIETQSTAAEAKLAAYGRSVNSTAGKASQALSKFGVTSGQVFAAAGVAAAAFVATSVKAYAEHQRVVALLANQLKVMPALAGATTQAFEKQATALQNLTGFTDEQVLAADTVLTRFNLTEKQIRSAIPTVLDYARAVGIDATQAATNLGKGSLGMGRALLSVGIRLTSAQKAALTFDKTIELMRGHVSGTSEAFGRTFEGRLAILGAKFNDLQEAIGRGLVPALTDAADAAIKLLDAGNKLGGMVGGRLQALADLTGITNTSSAATNLLSGHFKEAGRRFLDFLNPVDSVKQALTGSTEATDKQASATQRAGAAAQRAVPAIRTEGDVIEAAGTAASNATQPTLLIAGAFGTVAHGARTAASQVAAYLAQLRGLKSFGTVIVPGVNTVQGRTVGHAGGAVSAAGIFHRGGSVPRFHGGGDVPAILQTGEFVMSRQAVNAWGMNMMRAINNGSPRSAPTQVKEETHYHFDVPTDQAVTKLDHMTTWRRRSRGYTGGPF